MTKKTPISIKTPQKQQSNNNKIINNVSNILNQNNKSFLLPTKSDTINSINKFWDTMKLEDKNSQLTFLMNSYQKNNSIIESDDTKEFSFSNSICQSDVSINDTEVNISIKGDTSFIEEKENELNSEIIAEKIINETNENETNENEYQEFEFQEIQDDSISNNVINEEELISDDSSNNINNKLIRNKVSNIQTNKSELRPIILNKSLESAVLILKPGARFHDNITLQTFQVYVIKGRISIKINNDEVKASRDDMFLIKRKTIYDIHSEIDSKLLLVFNPKE